ncbi:MAG: hypothetical protein WDN67_03865 [Candidatus Moraniibacteriota bacterium]
MNILALQVGLVAFFLVLEHAFLGILLPGWGPLLLVLSVLIAWTLLRGFPEALWIGLPFLILSDVLIDGQVSFVSPLTVIVAYAVSFFSRRFFLEHRMAAVVFYSLGTAVAGYAFNIFDAFLRGTRGPAAFWPPADPLLYVVTASLIFSLTFFFLEYWERIIERLYQESTMNIR